MSSRRSQAEVGDGVADQGCVFAGVDLEHAGGVVCPVCRMIACAEALLRKAWVTNPVRRECPPSRATSSGL